MTQLNELHIRTAESDIDLETLAMNLKQLKRLWIQGTDGQIILPFIRHSKTLKIAIVRLSDAEEIDLLAMNQERNKLERPSNVLIGVQENVYLNTKGMSQNRNLSLVQITREESVHRKFEYISTYVEY